MEAYRSAEEAARLRAAELEGELVAINQANLQLARDIDAATAETNLLAARLAEAGPAGGAAGASRDRVALLAMLLAVAGFPLLSLHASWHRFASDVTVLPALLLLGAPGALAAWIAFPHRRASFGCRAAVWLGASFAMLAAVHAMLGGLP